MPSSRRLPIELHRFELQKRQVLTRLRLGYLLALAVCLLYLTLYPVWIGQTYYLEDGTNKASYPRFGLVGGNDSERHLVWEPPTAFSTEIEATVRWPWQLPSMPSHVEIDEKNYYYWVLACVLVLGIALKMAYMIFAPDTRDWFLTFVMMVTIVLLIVLFVIFGVVILWAGVG